MRRWLPRLRLQSPLQEQPDHQITVLRGGWRASPVELLNEQANRAAARQADSKRFIIAVAKGDNAGLSLAVSSGALQSRLHLQRPPLPLPDFAF